MTIALLGLLAAFALAGCGGDDAVPLVNPPATVNATADSATVPWKAPATLDVLANDSASSGTLSLAAVGTAAHGSVAIVGDKLSYTPAAGYFGEDRVSYSV